MNIRHAFWGFSLMTLVCVQTSWALPREIIPEMRGGTQPQVSVAPNGSIHVVFGKENAIYHSCSNDTGVSFSKPVRIAALSKLALGMRRGPRVMATNRIVTVSAVDFSGGNLLAWNSTDGGRTWSKPTQINSVAGSAREGLHAMTSNGQGLALIVWLDLRNTGTELWRVTSRDGGLTWDPNIQLYASPEGHICECCHPSLAINAQGEVAAMWRNWVAGARDLYISRSSDGGQAWTPAQKLGQGTWKLNGCPMDGGSLAFSPKGDLRAAWRSGTSIYSGQAGTPSAPEPHAETLLSNRGSQPVTFETRSGAAFVWEDGGKLWLRQGTGIPAPLTQAGGSFPSVSTTANGKAVLVWESSEGDLKKIFMDILE